MFALVTALFPHATSGLRELSLELAGRIVKARSRALVETRKRLWYTLQ